MKESRYLHAESVSGASAAAVVPGMWCKVCPCRVPGGVLIGSLRLAGEEASP